MAEKGAEGLVGLAAVTYLAAAISAHAAAIAATGGEAHATAHQVRREFRGSPPPSPPRQGGRGDLSLRIGIRTGVFTLGEAFGQGVLANRW